MNKQTATPALPQLLNLSSSATGESTNPILQPTYSATPQSTFYALHNQNTFRLQSSPTPPPQHHTLPLSCHHTLPLHIHHTLYLHIHHTFLLDLHMSTYPRWPWSVFLSRLYTPKSYNNENSCNEADESDWIDFEGIFEEYDIGSSYKFRNR